SKFSATASGTRYKTLSPSALSIISFIHWTSQTPIYTVNIDLLYYTKTAAVKSTAVRKTGIYVLKKTAVEDPRLLNHLLCKIEI
ncbi:MAG: hypothetical protein IJR22_03295, partial [Acidaminococcaceae bacterium]|nr:hypothetical protein [Acidaminococcaceae bacterium]